VALVLDLTGLQHVVGKYSAQHNLIVAAGPLAAATFARVFITKNKLVSTALVVGGAWLAIREFSGPALGLMQEQFGYLQGLLGTFRS
jgi:hypothetical protein